MMISDGFGPASQTFARTYYAHMNNLPYNYTTSLDSILVGTSRTRSASSLITDSAAGATAMSCGLKTWNGVIGAVPKDPNTMNTTLWPCATVLEGAKAIGMKTGMVVTSRITHATPAGYSAHVVGRQLEDAIAVQQLGLETPFKQRPVDLMFGGGSCFFLPKSANNVSRRVPAERGWADVSCRRDNRDLFAEASKAGWNVMTTRQQFDALKVGKGNDGDQEFGLPLVGLFGVDHLAYNIDRDASREPSLKEMVSKALDILSSATADSEKGFFLLIEGSRIDMAAHSNDPATHIHEILHYHQVIQTVKDFVDANPNTVMISTSDHETGGLSIGKQFGATYPPYQWNPTALSKPKCSTITAASMIKAYLRNANPTNADFESFLRSSLLLNELGINNPSEVEMNYLVNRNNTLDNLDYFLGTMVSNRALISWATHGHSGVDVNLYAYGTHANRLRGNHENTFIADFVSSFLGLDLKSLTDFLRTGFVIM